MTREETALLADQRQEVRIEVLPYHRDSRGGVFDPLPRESLQNQANLHVCISAPGAIRGNHYHPRGTEVLIAVGPASVRTRSQGVTTDSQVPASEVWRFTIPPGVSHAIRNDGNLPAVVVSFNSEPHDPAQPDLVREVIL